jgi:hypothetical protein
MAGISVHYDIQTALLNILQGATFPGLPSSSIKVRMLPKVGENLDTLPCILISPYGNIDWFPLSFEGDVNRTYYVEVSLVAANNFDFASNQEQYEGWLEQAGRLVTPPNLDATTPSLPNVWRIEMVSNPTFDRGRLNQTYAYQSVLVKFDSQEPRN